MSVESDRQKSIEAGANDFLPKPIQKKELLDSLQKHLNLEWLYEAHTEGTQYSGVANQENSSVPMTDMVFPGVEEMKKLHDLSRKGLINDLLTEIDRIEKLNSKFQPFTKTLGDLAKGFKLRQMKTFIEQFL